MPAFWCYVHARAYLCLAFTLRRPSSRLAVLKLLRLTSLCRSRPLNTGSGLRAIIAPSYKHQIRQNQTLTTSKRSIEFTCSNFPCHLKVNIGKFALINRQWNCKKGQRLTIIASSYTGKYEQDDSDRRMGKFRPLP